MSVNTMERIEDIHSMLASGHRSIQLERHTLILWGLAAAFLILAVPVIFAPEYFELRWQRAVSQNIFMSVLLIAVGVVDFKLTRRVRENRNETVSFVQQQLTKVWWLMVGLIVVINLGMNFFGGGYIFFAVVLLITGVALYVQGLFSQQMLCWVGAMMIALGLSCVALKIPHREMQWIVASVFGLGFPALAWLVHNPSLQTNIAKRSIFSVIWLALVIAPPALAYQMTKHAVAPKLASVTLQEYMNAPLAGAAETQVVRLPAGTTIPINVKISGDVLEGTTKGTIPMKLSSDLELVIENNKPEGRFRVGDGIWKHRLYNYRIRSVKREVKLSQDSGPQVNMEMRISTNN